MTKSKGVKANLSDRLPGQCSSQNALIDYCELNQLTRRYCSKGQSIWLYRFNGHWTLDFGLWTLDQAQAMQVNLRVLAGPYKDRVFSFTQPDTFLIGRSNDAHLCLTDDKFFSRHHCLLEINPPHCFLRDLGSTNGTFVNGQRVTETFLENGAQIQGGETVLLVEVSTGETNALASASQPEHPVKPTIVTVACLNCGRREEAQATSSEEHLTFLCEDCRIELKKTPQPIPGYDMVRDSGPRRHGLRDAGPESRQPAARWLSRHCCRNLP